MAGHIAVWLTGLGLLIAFSQSASIAFADGQRNTTDKKSATTQPTPKPQLTPKAVATIVVNALGNNDANDNGIRTTWKFASPNNQQATGPIERFIPMVKSPAYQPMLNHRAAEVRELTVDGDAAAELAIITDANGDKAYYIFQLSKQTDGDLKDCWMTDGVLRVQPNDVPEKPEHKAPDGQFPA